MPFGVGIYKFKVQFQSIGGRTAQVIVKGETVVNSRAEGTLGVVNLT